MIFIEDFNTAQLMTYFAYLWLLVGGVTFNLIAASLIRFSPAGDHCANGELKTQGFILKWHLIINYFIVGAIVSVVCYFRKRFCEWLILRISVETNSEDE